MLSAIAWLPGISWENERLALLIGSLSSSKRLDKTDTRERCSWFTESCYTGSSVASYAGTCGYVSRLLCEKINAREFNRFQPIKRKNERPIVRAKQLRRDAALRVTVLSFAKENSYRQENCTLRNAAGMRDSTLSRIMQWLERTCEKRIPKVLKWTRDKKKLRDW